MCLSENGIAVRVMTWDAKRSFTTVSSTLTPGPSPAVTQNPVENRFAGEGSSVLKI
jgi:hypothetical protein